MTKEEKKQREQKRLAEMFSQFEALAARAEAGMQKVAALEAALDTDAA